VPVHPDADVTLPPRRDPGLAGQPGRAQLRRAGTGDDRVRQPLGRVGLVERLTEIAVRVGRADIHRDTNGDDQRDGRELPALPPQVTA
jgi:hypothetical protein